MTWTRVRLPVAATLFITWLAFLLYLVTKTRGAVVLSRPQILSADLCLIAQLTDDGGQPSPKVLVTRLLWPENINLELVGKEIEVSGLSGPDHPPGWVGAGAYLLGLSLRSLDGGYHFSLTQVPHMPGFQPTQALQVLDHDQWRTVRRFVPLTEAQRLAAELAKNGTRVRSVDDDTRIYPATPEVLQQFRRIRP